MTDEISLPDLPHHLAVMLGTTDFIGGLLATGIFFMLFIVPILFLTKGRNVLLSLTSGILVLGICTALTWLPVWILIIIGLLIALMFSGAARGWITGHGEH